MKFLHQENRQNVLIGSKTSSIAFGSRNRWVRGKCLRTLWCTVLHCTAIQSSVVTAVICGVLQFGALHCKVIKCKKIMLVIVLQQNMCARVCTSRLFRMPINFSIVPHFALDCSSLLVCVPHRLIWKNFSISDDYSYLYLTFLSIVPQLEKNAIK